MEKLTGWHVTNPQAFSCIEREGLRGTAWMGNSPSDWAQSETRLGANLSDDGAVFCFPSLETAQAAIEDGYFGDDPIILEITGEGIRYFHEGALQEEIVMVAQSCDWGLA